MEGYFLRSTTTRTTGTAGGFAFVAVMVFILQVLGCASPTPESGSTAAVGNVSSGNPVNRPAGTTQTMEIVAAVLPLGSVPYDNLALPLIRPDGSMVAVQTGAPPTWPSVLAEHDAQIPTATKIEVYEFDRRENIADKDRLPPRLLFSLKEPAILGRSSNETGFLIESPRDDGSRWIGKVAWSETTGDIEWLVQGSDVNAFAFLSDGGKLAWSRRLVAGERFELVVRESDSTDVEWTLTSSTGDWLLPTWSRSATRPNGLFAAFLETGNLEIRHLIADNAATAQQSLRRLSLATECDVHTAYQTMSGQSSASAGGGSEQLVFFHPSLRRVALWRPLALADRQRIHLNARSVAALVDQENFAFVATTNHLIRQNLRNPNERLNLVAGLQIPCPTRSPTWPYILLALAKDKSAC